MLHIGIVGCSAEGAALCYRTICIEGPQLLGGHDHPQVSMHTHSLQRYHELLDAADMAGIAELMLDSARRLAAAGADLVICPDNTIHAAFQLVAPRSPLPWLHIAEVVGDEAARQGVRRAGITGTPWLVRSDVYPAALGRLGIEAVRPADADVERLGAVIMDELVRGVVRPESVADLLAIIERLADRGCDAVVLGCTELPLAIDAATSPLPVLDSTRLLARAALERAVAG